MPATYLIRALSLTTLAAFCSAALAVDLKVSAQGIELQPAAPAPAYQVRVTGPGDLRFEDTFIAGEAISLSDQKMGTWPDGSYTFEIWPILGMQVRTGDSFDPVKADPSIVAEQGVFSVIDGRFYLPSDGEAEPVNSGKPSRSRRVTTGNTIATKDQVINDDLIVTGSVCVGFDCVNDEVFGFDTIKLKENNTRIKFEDTSTTAGFAGTDWQLTANDSASGGLNKFSIEDITAATVPFTVEGGSPTNSLYVDSTGRIGLRTSTPVLDLHVSTSNTPGLRLEQNNSGGFTAQTWDIAGNEANFFVRDVTGGSRLPFRIRPGAPTSSIDIAANGNVGIGTASPAGSGFETRFVEIKSERPALVLDAGAGASDFSEVLFQEDNANRWSFGTTSGSDRFYFYNYSRSAYDLTIANASGNIGLGGVLAAASPIQHSNGALLTAGGVWQNASTREVKESIQSLTFDAAREALLALAPVTFRYITDPADLNVGFIAEDVPDLVATESRKTLSSMDIVAVLTRVVQEQEAQIEKLNERLQRLESSQD